MPEPQSPPAEASTLKLGDVVTVVEDVDHVLDGTVVNLYPGNWAGWIDISTTERVLLRCNHASVANGITPYWQAKSV